MRKIVYKIDPTFNGFQFPQKIFADLSKTQTKKIHLSDLATATASAMSRHKLGNVLFTSTTASVTLTTVTSTPTTSTSGNRTIIANLMQQMT